MNTHYKDGSGHTKRYLKFLHELTLALYEKDLMIPTAHSELIECFYLQGFSIEKSVQQYIAHTTQRDDLTQSYIS